MPIDDKVAAAIADRIARASSLCAATLFPVKKNECLGHIRVYGRLVGNFMGHSYTDVLGPIWRKFPELEPPEMKGTFTPPEPTLSAESEQAIVEFVREAKSALEFAQSAAPPEQLAECFKDGLSELAGAIREIEAFLRHPRFRDPEENHDTSA